MLGNLGGKQSEGICCEISKTAITVPRKPPTPEFLANLTRTKTSTPSPCPKSTSARAVSSWRAILTNVCAVHPAGPSTNTCPDFQENPDAASEDLWEPFGASYYSGELILQRPAAVDFGTAARTFGHPPLVYRPVSPM
jgi:hypothetical protein